MSPLYFVDGFNFLHAVVLTGRDRSHWWSRENQAKVVAAVAELRIMSGAPDVCIVFDRRREAVDEGGSEEHEPILPSSIQIRHAPDADDYIVQRCGELAGQREVVVVTADRSLRDRARNHGARSLSPWTFASTAASPSVRPNERG
jgi:predicted RNA-binding protein with PIN domain